MHFYVKTKQKQKKNQTNIKYLVNVNNILFNKKK